MGKPKETVEAQNASMTNAPRIGRKRGIQDIYKLTKSHADGEVQLHPQLRKSRPQDQHRTSRRQAGNRANAPQAKAKIGTSA